MQHSAVCLDVVCVVVGPRVILAQPFTWQGGRSFQLPCWIRLVCRVLCTLGLPADCDKRDKAK